VIPVTDFCVEKKEKKKLKKKIGEGEKGWSLGYG
jgi:hypothetical protein